MWEYRKSERYKHFPTLKYRRRYRLNNLECINCGEIYYDRWSEDKSPICPNCGVSHYVESEAALQHTTRRNYRKTELQLEKEVSPYWLPYYVLQIVSEHVPEIDQVQAHRAGLALRGKPAGGILWQRVLKNLIVDSNRARNNSFLDIAVEGTDTPSDEDIEFDTVMRDYITWLSRKWKDEAIKRKYTLSLEEAVNYPWPGRNAAIDEANAYAAVKKQLQLFRRKLNLVG